MQVKCEGLKDLGQTARFPKNISNGSASLRRTGSILSPLGPLREGYVFSSRPTKGRICSPRHRYCRINQGRSFEDQIKLLSFPFKVFKSNQELIFI